MKEEWKTKRREIRAVILTLTIASTLCVAFNITPAFTQEESTLYIYEDYTFTHNIYGRIVVAADNIVIDGNGYTLKGPGPWNWQNGFYLWSREGVTIKNVVIKDWGFGINLATHSNGNTLSGNTVSDNMVGIGVYGYCDDNTLSGNTVSDNMVGIDVYSYCDGNTLTDNTVSGNSIGIELSTWSMHNLVYHNNIINNAPTQAYDTNTWANDWHHPDLLEGNYWSDYPGVDDGSGTDKHAIAGDGIGDTDIPWPKMGFYDYYPLMLTWIPEPVEAMEDLDETIESWNLPKGAENGLTFKLDAAISLLNNGNINGAIHKLGDFINQVEAQRGKKLTNDEADYLISEAQAIIFAIS